jgi:hypothetical protein
MGKNSKRARLPTQNPPHCHRDGRADCGLSHNRDYPHERKDKTKDTSVFPTHTHIHITHHRHHRQAVTHWTVRVSEGEPKHTYRGDVFAGELVGGVGDEEARLTDGAVTHHDTLDSLHCFVFCLPFFGLCYLLLFPSPEKDCAVFCNALRERGAVAHAKRRRRGEERRRGETTRRCAELVL